MRRWAHRGTRAFASSGPLRQRARSPFVTLCTVLSLCVTVPAGAAPVAAAPESAPPAPAAPASGATHPTAPPESTTPPESSEPAEPPPLPLDGPPPGSPEPLSPAPPAPLPESKATPQPEVAAAGTPEQKAWRRQKLLNDYAGRRCLLEPAGEQHVELDPLANPEDLPPVNTAPRYRPTAASVFVACGSLGCVDDENASDPKLGVCALPTSVEDCAGAADPAQHDGLCGEPHVPLPDIQGIHAHRFLLTGGALAEFLSDPPGKDAGVDVVAGALYQLSFTKSKAIEKPDGGYDHVDLPHLYLHVEAFASRQRVGHDVGLVYKTGWGVVTRLGAAAFGQGWGPVDFLTNNSYRIGPSLHVELMNNLLLRAALPYWGTDPGPKLVFSVTYAAGLLDDFR